MSPKHKARMLSRKLVAVVPRCMSAAELEAVAAAGQSASTSTSGTPAAGDDTIGDSSGLNNLRQLGLALM